MSASVSIDIGCGRNKLEGSIGIDTSPYSAADVVLDLNVDPLPFEDSSVDFTHTSHALEHLTWDGFLHVVDEMYRVTKPGGQIYIVTPYFHQTANLANPFHNNNVCFNEHTFRFFSSEPECPALDPIDYAVPSCPQWGLRYSATAELGVELRTLAVDLIYYPEYATLSAHAQRQARRHESDVVEQIAYWLTPIKPCPRVLDDTSITPPDRHGHIEQQLAYHAEQVAFFTVHEAAVDDVKRAASEPAPFVTATAILSAWVADEFVREGDLYRRRATGLLHPAHDIVGRLDQRIQALQAVIDATVEHLRADAPQS